MDSIRSFALASFNDQRFQEPPPQRFDILTIESAASDEASPHAGEASTELRDSSSSLQEITHLAASHPALLLVQVEYELRTPVHTFHASRDDIQTLARITEIDQCGLGLVSNDTTGFHRVTAGDGDEAAYRPATYYLYCAAFKFLWAYDPHRRSTKAIAFMASAVSSGRAMEAYLQFVSCLRDPTTLGMLATHPLLLPLSGLAQSMAWAERTLRSQYSKCRVAEQGSGVHPWRPAAGPDEKGDTVRELADIARQMTALVVEVEMMVRRLRQWKMAIAAYEEMQQAHMQKYGGSCSHHQAEHSVSDALHLTRSKLNVMELDCIYVRERAKNQTAAVTQIMTRDDALVSIDLSRSAARDGASMKVVAIMTMAFLPGTFFAALFAVPSLRWEDDADSVVGKGFWIYWAFTLPLTVFVFILWALLTQREEMMQIRVDMLKLTLGRLARDGGQKKPEARDDMAGQPTQPFNSILGLPRSILSFPRKSVTTASTNSERVNMSRV